MDSAMRLLSRRNHTEKELALKLRQRGYEIHAIQDVISKCKRLNYIDDASTAISFVMERKRKSYGPLHIRQSMQRKGFCVEDIETALNANYPFDEELKNAKEVALKKSSRSFTNIDQFTRNRKLYAYLSSRGFSAEAIAQILFEK